MTCVAKLSIKEKRKEWQGPGGGGGGGGMHAYLLRSLIFAYVRLYLSGSLILSRCDMTQSFWTALSSGGAYAFTKLLTDRVEAGISGRPSHWHLRAALLGQMITDH